MLTLADSVQDFLLHLDEVGRSPRTREAYERAISRLTSHLTGAGFPPDAAISSLSAEHLRGFSRALFREGLSSRTRATLLSAVRSYLRYLIRPGYQVPSPDLVEMPKVAHNLSEFDERLVETVESPPPPRSSETSEVLALRDRAVLLTLYSTQFRVADLCRLNRGQIDPELGIAVVVGKGQKTRSVFFGPKATAAIDGYLAARADHYRLLFFSGTIEEERSQTLVMIRMARLFGSRLGASSDW